MLKTPAGLFAAILIYHVIFGSIACVLLPVGSFRSPEERTEATLLPMSDTEPGLFVTYHPTISFQEGQFHQQESDYFFAGPHVCRFGIVVASHSNGTSTSVGYIPLLGVLLWGGQWYLNTTQLPFLLILLIVGMGIRALYRKGRLHGIVRRKLE